MLLLLLVLRLTSDVAGVGIPEKTGKATSNIEIVSQPWLAGEVASESLPDLIINDYNPFPGDFWLGETIRFIPEMTPSGRMLRQVGNPQAGSHTIYTNSSVYYGSWEFSVLFDGFTTSNQNRAWVWLMADDSEMPAGYAVRIGENGTMKYARLFRLRGLDTPIEILQSSRVLPDDNKEFNVRVERTAGGLWRLGVQTQFDSTWQWNETTDDANPFFAPFFGFHTNFSSTRSDRFLFGPVRIEKTPTFARGIRVISPGVVVIELSDFQSEPSVEARDIIIRDSNRNQIPVSRLRAEGFNLIVELQELLSGGSYEIHIVNIRNNLTGGLQPGVTFEFNVFDSASFGDIIINEFTPKVQDGGVPQFIELHNTSDKFINLNEWTIGRSSQFATLNNLSLRPGEFRIIGRPSAEWYFSESFHAVNLPVLTRNQDNLWLRDAQGVLIDSVAYNNTHSAQLSDGQSLERINPRYPGIDPINWTPNPVMHHTAGKPNAAVTAMLPDLELNNVRLVNDNLVQADFNLFISSVDEAAFYLNGIRLNIADWSWQNGNTLTFHIDPNSDWIGRKPGIFTAENVQRADRSQSQFFDREVAQPVRAAGDLLINEILYQPIQGRYDSFPDQSEYIEIYNSRPYAVHLSTVFIADSPDKHNEYRIWEPVNPMSWRLEGNHYGLIYADTSRVWENSRIARYFNLQNNPGYARVNRSTLGLTSSGRGVYLRTADLVIDSVYYQPAWHHPYISDPRGRSLERLGFKQPDHMTWSTSVSALGGTPGRTNSISMPEQLPAEAMIKSGIYMNPNPFSPDFDGRQDFTEITVITPSEGYSVTLQIFNRFGRLVKTLNRDQLSGHSQSIIWDGTDSNGLLLPTGVYVIFAELKHPQQRTVYYKEPLVLVRRN